MAPKRLAKSPKLVSFPGNLLISMVISSFVFGAIVGTVITYWLLDVKPADDSDLTQEGETYEIAASVTKVIDGDTIAIDLSGQERVVRYLGIDTPENKGIEQVYYGKEALEKNQELVGEKQVRLVCERKFLGVSRRLLAYVYVGETFVNAEMVDGGYATVYRRNASEQFSMHRHYEYFLRLEQEARKKQVGIWDNKKKREWEQQYGTLLSVCPTKYIADSSDRYFHRPDCPKTEKIKFKLYYYERQTASEQRLPCPICNP